MSGSAAAEPVGSVDTALAHAVRLLEREPALAAEQATEILKAVPHHPHATLILAAARRSSGDAPQALTLLAPLLKQQPRWATLHYELGMTFSALGRGEEAVGALRQAAQLSPESPSAWRALADQLAA